jgi:predicted nucleic acid-binding protein
MKDVAKGRITLREVTDDLLLKAGHLLWRVGVQRNLHIRTYDALQVESALAVSRALGVKVWFATTDRRLANTVRSLTDICATLVLKYRNP